jgi:Kef-type K+ transport system membrane component KefB
MKTTEATKQNPQRHALRLALGYGLVAAAAVMLLWWYRNFGAVLNAPPPAPGQELFGSRLPSHSTDMLLHVLLALAVVIVSARAVGAVFLRCGQPAVIGEIVAGIMLGPSFLGHFWPQLSTFLLPAHIMPALSVFAQIGVILYMFLIGMELNPAHLRRSSAMVMAISHSSIVFPFLLGAGLSIMLYPLYATSDVPYGVFLLFIGISMSVTAFPVLARILTDRGMQHSSLGTIALACAAIDDVTAWCALAFIVSVAKMNLGDAAQTLGLSILYIAFVLLIGRHLIHVVVARAQARATLGEGTVALALTGLLLSALTTEWIGIHALFGAFLLGAIIPHDSSVARHLLPRLRDIAVVLFLPAYFALTGLRTEIGLVDGASAWLMLGLIILVASLGKFGGSILAARLSGLSWRQGAAIGILMNTRGLMELVVLNIGLELKVLSPTLFAMMVLMAIATTFATTPLLNYINRRLPWAASAPATDVAAATPRVAQMRNCSSETADT